MRYPADHNGPVNLNERRILQRQWHFAHFIHFVTKKRFADVSVVVGKGRNHA